MVGQQFVIIATDIPAVNAQVMEDAQEVQAFINEADEPLNERSLRNLIIDTLNPYLYKQTARRPMILPVLMGVSAEDVEE